jgi:glycosyltransferase involved in cell wall biosynthesis
MQICLIGDFCRNLDEGYKNTSHYLAAGLERHHAVLRLNAKHAGSVAFWRDFRRACPDIIHTIAQPTGRSLVLTYLLRRFRPHARTVISALRGESYFAGRHHGARQCRLLRVVPPDLVLAQTIEAEALFKGVGCRTLRLPNGVDLERFKPVTSKWKRDLRQKYGVGLDRPVVLHVGHLHAARNLEALMPLPATAKQVVVAGSLYMGTDHGLIERLERARFQLFKGYQPRVEELYQIADCYVFPTDLGDSISMPLSVLEAMACNLPIVTTRFAGLEQHFVSGHGFAFVDSPGEIPTRVDEALQTTDTCATRAMVQEFSWEAVTDRLQTYYRGLIAA